MKLDLSDDAVEFGRVVRDALGTLGGDALIQRAQQDPVALEAEVGDLLGTLGVWDLDVRGSTDELEAAAAVCRSAGWWAAPGAVPYRLARPTDLGGFGADALAVVAGARPAAPMHSSGLRWAGVDLDGHRGLLRAAAGGSDARSATDIVDVDVDHLDADGAQDVVLGLLLPVWTLLGMLDRAVATTVEYVNDRHQFGKPLAAFQSVQFQLTDAEVERVGLEELAKYSLWSFQVQPTAALTDALAARLAGIEAADRVMRICHQLHGAIGFCDEATISWLSRCSRGIRTLPLPLSGTRDELVRRAGRRGLAGLYGG